MQYMKQVYRRILIASVFLLMGLLMVGCSVRPAESEAATPAPTVAPTEAPTLAPTPTFEQVAVQTPEPTEAATPEPTPAPTETPAPMPTPFSIVWMSDTQNLSRHDPESFNSMRDWILNERESQNIAFVIHTGDVVDGCSTSMWDNASVALVPLFYEIPGMIVSGNHDISSANKQSLFYERPYARMIQKEGQTFKDGTCAYQTFTAGGDEFLVFGFGYGVHGREVWDWTESVISEHPDAVILFVMHYGLQGDNRYSGQARELFLNIAEKTPNAKMLLCGHHAGILRHEDPVDDDGDGETDRIFYTLMFNVQDDLEEGTGFMRILTFDPADRHIEVRLYSPVFDSWEYPKALPEENRFILENAY